jgi:hypothetical protein
MGYASQAGRARTSAKNPQAHAICDRCGFRYNHVDLRWQFDWRGTSLQNIRLLVCSSCTDEAQQQLRAIVIPADPVPIVNPRIQDFVTAETNNRATSGTVVIPISGTGSGAVATLTLGVPSTFPAIPVGNLIVVQGMEPAGFNGSFIVTACAPGSPYTVSYASKVLGPMVVAGTVAVSVDRDTGIPVVNLDHRITQANQNRITQQTGEPPYGMNQEPGTNPDAPGNSDPGLPYNNIVVPQTGPLT